MAGMGVACQSFNSDLLFEPWEVLSDEGEPLTCFQEYWERCGCSIRRPSVVPEPYVIKLIITICLSPSRPSCFAVELFQPALVCVCQDTQHVHARMSLAWLSTCAAYGWR